jgi:FkbM family methyltransferase
MNQDSLSDFRRIYDLNRILNDDSIIIDVGAHKGEFSTSIRTITSANIFAFEPVPEAFNVLSDKLRGDNFFPINKAIDSTDGMANFHVVKSYLSSSLLPAVPKQDSTWLHETKQI